MNGWEVLSDTGYQPISMIGKTIEYDVWYLRTTSFELHCADDHIVFLEDGTEIFVKDLRIGQKIKTVNGSEAVLVIYSENRQEAMYDVQVDSESHSYLSNCILSHNTTVTVCYLLYYIIFNGDKNVALLANKGSMAREILSRIQTAFIHLPKWMQVGVEEWNKGSIKLENGSKVIAAATSSDSVRRTILLPCVS